MTRRLLLATLPAWLGLAAAAATTAPARDPDALWRIVHERCVPDQRTRSDPAPCASVDLSHGEQAGSVVLKDAKGDAQYLLIPTARIGGIESPAILAPDAPNYFAEAWAAIRLVEARLHRTLPREDFALAINAQDRRSQDQLHIHVDCVGAGIRAALEPVPAQLDGHWRALPMRLALHRYRALWLPGETPGANPFRLLAASLADPATEMGRHSLVLVGATRSGRPGFVLLDGVSEPLAVAIASRIRLGPGWGGSGEELEDHACRVAARPG